MLSVSLQTKYLSQGTQWSGMEVVWRWRGDQVADGKDLTNIR